MSTSSDVKAKTLTATGDLSVGPARIRQIQLLTAGSGSPQIVVKDGGSGGDTILDLKFSTGVTYSVNIPSDGVRSEADPHFTLTNITQMTVFYA